MADSSFCNPNEDQYDTLLEEGLGRASRVSQRLGEGARAGDGERVWKVLDVVPVRLAYFIGLIASDCIMTATGRPLFADRSEPSFPFGPRLLTAEIGAAWKAEGVFPNPRQWLIADSHLCRLLTRAGLRWFPVEQAVARAFATCWDDAARPGRNTPAWLDSRMRRGTPGACSALTSWVVMAAVFRP